MAVTIYHNPRCSKSRQTLELIKQSGVPQTIVLYLDNAPDGETIRSLAKRLGLPVAGLLRRDETAFKDAKDVPNLSDDTRLAEWISRHPVVLERPIVVDDETGKVIIGRPPENVLALVSA
jgi:arsenate reductase